MLTRFNAPVIRSNNTFDNYQPLLGSGMFISENERFSKDPNARQHF